MLPSPPPPIPLSYLQAVPTRKLWTHSHFFGGRGLHAARLARRGRGAGLLEAWYPLPPTHRPILGGASQLSPLPHRPRDGQGIVQSQPFLYPFEVLAGWGDEEQ